MKFEFNGIEFDSNKPIYVMGIQYGKKNNNWFPGNISDISEYLKRQCYYQYKKEIKKLYITELRFNKFNCERYESNDIKEMRVMSSQRDIAVWINKEYIIGRSPQECLKIYNKQLEATDKHTEK